LYTIDLDKRDITPRLTLNVDDNEFFKKRILLRPGESGRAIPATKGSHRRIESVAALAKAHILDVLTPVGGTGYIAELNRWIQFVKNTAQVVVLRVPDGLNGYRMFETLNDRGLRTSQADLVKNYLFDEARADRLQEAQTKWSGMIGALESLDVDEVTVTYLR